MIKTLTVILLIGLLAACAPLPEGDLYAGAQSSRMTAEAAMRDAQYQEQALTATAVAPLVHITETAAGMAVQAQYWTATAQSVEATATAAMTQTAQSWTATPNATSTAVFMLQSAEATQMANAVERDTLELERQTLVNQFWALVFPITFVLAVAGVIMSLTWLARRERYRPATVDARGNVIPIMDVVEGTVTDVDRNPNYRGLLANNMPRRWIEQKLALPAPVPEITAERQDATTARDQAVDLKSRGLSASGSRPGGPQPGAPVPMQAPKLTDGMSPDRFRIIHDGAGLDVIDSEILRVLDEDWRKANERNN